MNRPVHKQPGYDTNLAAEYYVLSVLYRKGIEAYLTVGNKKAIDIVVRLKDGRTLTLDVKGLAGTTCWPIENMKPAPGHYIAFVSFLGAIANEGTTPEVYVVPSEDVETEGLDYRNPKHSRHVVQLSRLRKARDEYRDKWAPFLR